MCLWGRTRPQRLTGSLCQHQQKSVGNQDVKFEENLASRKSHELSPVVEDE